ncbi:hypothetical protein HOLleu_14431 [Holothuria leucospilota]|uniref:Fibronectin type-III domain-containing protein n=1 Tax=Holothuria leucospilota TaxID=206669 RepID=A0A9Q1C7N2_HOLLE|nr:hypothetical protein HOLleu_14431 [Holothuria leucospilota]
MFTVYYSSSKGELSSVNTPEPTALSLSVAHPTPGLSYSFHVTLSTSGGESEESTKVEKFVPVLPSLTNLPSPRSVTCNSVTLIWQKWTNGTDQGTPPTVHYIPYQTTKVSHDWISGDMVTYDDTVEEYQFTFSDLTEDTTYEFSVVVA